MPRSSARRSSTPASRTTRRSSCRHAGAETPKAALSGGLRISGAEGARTPDLRAASATLSQLSYSPKPVIVGPCNADPLIVPGRREAEMQHVPALDMADRDEEALVEVRAEDRDEIHLRARVCRALVAR